MSRYWLIALLCAACGALAAAVFAQPQPAPLAAEPLGGGVYWFRGGSGANTGLIIAGKEAVVIDAKMTQESAQAMLEEVRKLTLNPVRYLILTHSDGDHVNGLGGFPRNLRVLAHPNALKDMEQAFKDPKLSSLAGWLPMEAVSPGGGRIEIGGVPVELLHFGPAHTNGDLVVFLPRQRIAFVGDLVFIGRDPLIHRHKNGSSFGLVETLKKLLELDCDRYVSGHANPVGKTEIRELLASLQDKQAKVKTLIGEGQSLEQIKAALGVAEQPGAVSRRPGLIEVIYQELAEKK
jgi:cyclase